MTIENGPLFTPLTIEEAPEASKPALEEIKRTVGFVPNLMAIFAHNPAVLSGYLALEKTFEHGTFTPRDRQIILLVTSVENKCNYCTAAHSTIAQAFLLTPAAIISAIVLLFIYEAIRKKTATKLTGWQLTFSSRGRSAISGLPHGRKRI